MLNNQNSDNVCTMTIKPKKTTSSSQFIIIYCDEPQREKIRRVQRRQQPWLILLLLILIRPHPVPLQIIMITMSIQPRRILLLHWSKGTIVFIIYIWYVYDITNKNYNIRKTWDLKKERQTRTRINRNDNKKKSINQKK